MISQETINEISVRSASRCENPFCNERNFGKVVVGGEHHHIYWRSQYKGKDRDQSWNLVYICKSCHVSIHVGGNTVLDKYLKALADVRRPKEEREYGRHKDLDTQKKRRRNKYLRAIEEFRKTHNGLSPTQVRYQQAKEYRRKNSITLN